MLLPSVEGQITNLLFSETFEGPTLDQAKFIRTTPFFEGGTGTFDVTQASGVVEFTGVVDEQWWPAASLRLAPTFAASEQTNIVLSVDRVSEGGTGSASRSTLWILDPTANYFVLFADVRAESGWRYNRKIGVVGDVPAGAGTELTVFNNAENLGRHNMKLIADGRNVQLYLDNIFGAEVAFPFPEFIFEFGTAARAKADTARTVFDNLKVEAVGAMTFSTTTLRLGTGQTAPGIVVRVPPGANASQAILVRVVSSLPQIGTAVGAVGDTLTLNFPAGGPNTLACDIQGLAIGACQFTLTNSVGIRAGNRLDLTVDSGPGVRLTENFTGNAIDPAKWTIHRRGFEGGAGPFEVTQANGVLRVTGSTAVDSWPGASLKTVDTFLANEDLPLEVVVDRISMDPTSLGGPTASSGARTGIYITTDDRSQYVFFGQNVGDTGWQVNVNPGNPVGSGTDLVVFNGLDSDLGNHQLKLWSDGKEVEVFLDGVSGGRFPYASTVFNHVELGAYSRATSDAVHGVFDNVSIANVLPCVKVAPLDVSTEFGNSGNAVRVTIPRLLNPVTTRVTVTSQNPAVAVPEGAVNGSLTLTFVAGSTNVQSFNVTTVGVGTTTFSLANDRGACVANGVNITVTPSPVHLVSDDFTSGALDASKWRTDNTPLVPEGVATAESGISVVNGAASIAVTGEVTGWPGFALMTASSFNAEATRPVTFEINRSELHYSLVTGSIAKQRTGIWITDETRSKYVFFNEYRTHDGSAGGWEYARVTGQAGDSPLALNGRSSTIAAFGSPAYNDGGNHRMKAVANGSTVKLYLDDLLGAEVPFPVASGIFLGAGAYVRAATDVMSGVFDNARVIQPAPLNEPLAVTLDVVDLGSGQRLVGATSLANPVDLQLTGGVIGLVGSGNLDLLSGSEPVFPRFFEDIRDPRFVFRWHEVPLGQHVITARWGDLSTSPVTVNVVGATVGFRGFTNAFPREPVGSTPVAGFLWIQNLGSVATGPLRVSLLRSSSHYLWEGAGGEPAEPSPEEPFEQFNRVTIPPLLPKSETSIEIPVAANVECLESQGFGETGSQHHVKAVLEEQIGSGWSVIDRATLLSGIPVPVFPPNQGMAGKDAPGYAAYSYLVSLGILGPDSVPEGQTAQFMASTTNSLGVSEVVTPTWSVLAPHQISSNGVFTAGLAGNDPTVRLNAGFRRLSATRDVKVVAPPTHTIRLGLDLSAGTTLQIRLQGLPARRYVLQESTDLRTWTGIETSLTDAGGDLRFAPVAIGGQNRARLFRAFYLP